MGQLYLTNVDFLKNGVPASIAAAGVNLFAQLEDFTHESSRSSPLLALLL